MTNETWATKTADSIMERTPRLYGERGYNEKWSYDYGVILRGFECLWKRTGDERYLAYIQENMDHFIKEDGSILGYRLEEFNIDHINNGKLLFLLHKETGDEKYRKAADLLREQLSRHPRTSEGVFWHKQIYPHQIWLDGLYMGTPFYAQYLLTWNGGEGIEDIIRQFRVSYGRLLNRETGLLHHAWDEKKQQPWAHEGTGLSANIWGRSVGWYVMALADTLEILPEDTAGRDDLATMLESILTKVKSLRDETGVWYQVLDQGGRKGNYLEASCSSMFVYAMAKGIRLGVLDREEWEADVAASRKGLISEFVLLTNEGLVNLNKNCQVAGLGGADQRDGSYAYYISEPIICNDQKGLGAFLQALCECEAVLEGGDASCLSTTSPSLEQ